MSLRHAVLGFLSVQPFTGYELKKTFDASVRHFWSSDKAALYRLLADLEREGLAESETVPQKRRPDRHVYRITDAGRSELDRWLRSAVDPPARREPLLVQVFFSDRLTPEERDALLARELATTEAEIAGLRAVAEDTGEPPRLTGPIVALHAGLASLLAWRDWLRSTRARLGDPDLVQQLLREIRGE